MKSNVNTLTNDQLATWSQTDVSWYEIPHKNQVSYREVSVVNSV